MGAPMFSTPKATNGSGMKLMERGSADNIGFSNNMDNSPLVMGTRLKDGFTNCLEDVK